MRVEKRSNFNIENMTTFWNVIFGAIIIILVASGLFDLIEWQTNLAALAVVVVIWIVSLYNGLIRGRTQVDEGWADIDVQLKRRYDLIPNLVETVRGYTGHEAQVFEKVSAARSAAMGASGPQAKASAENMLTGTLKSLFAVAEAYPQLRASENFNRLQADLTDTEDKIQAARRFYNGVVRDYNIAVSVFPTNVIAGLFGFSRREFFEIGGGEASQREAVKVRF